MMKIVIFISMKRLLLIPLLSLCTLQNEYGQTVRKSRPDTTAKSFIRMAKGCKLQYTSGGIGGDGEVDLFCAKVQFELQFINKYDTVESYADDYIFKMVGNVRQPELTNNYSTYDKFDCYALVYPHREKKPYIDFPVVISAYKRIKDDKWRYITTTTANNMEEYGNFEDKVIHNAYGDK